MREIEYDRKKQKDIPCSWIVWINIVKMSTLPVRRCTVIPNNRLKFFHITRINNPKIYIEPMQT